MFNVKKIIVSTLSKTDGLIRYATYNMAGNLSQQPGDRKRKSPGTQTMLVLNSGAKIRQTTETKLVRTRYGRTGFWLFFNVC